MASFFGALLAQKHADKIREEGYKFQAAHAVMTDPNQPSEYRQKALEEIYKLGGSGAKEHEGIFTHLKNLITGQPAAPQLRVPQLPAPPTQEDMNSPEGGVQPSAPAAAAGVPPPPRVAGAVPQLFGSPEEMGQEQLRRSLPALQFQMQMDPVLAARARQRAIETGINWDALTPTQKAQYMKEQTIPEVPFHALSEGQYGVQGGNVIPGPPKPIVQPPGSNIVIPAPPGSAGSAPQAMTTIPGPPPLLPPETRAAIAAYTAAHPNETVGPAETPKAVQWYKEQAMTPTEREMKASTLATQASSRARNNVMMQAYQAMQTMPDEALDMAAEKFLLTGNMPAIGRGIAGAVVQAKAYKRASVLADQRGMSAKAAMAQTLANKATSGAMNQLGKQEALIESFSTTASRNLDLALDLSNKVDRTGMPVFNRLLLKIKGQYAGDPEVARLEAAVRTATNEWAKVITGQTTGQAVSDAARKETDMLLNPNMTAKQFAGVVALAKQEMENRKVGFKSEKARLHSDLTGAPPPPGTEGGLTAPPTAHGIPDIGETFNGGRVIKVTPIP